MAIAQALPGLQVTVEVDGEPLKEYHAQGKVDEAANVVRYIEAATNKRFTVNVAVPRGFRTAGVGLAVKCMVDGEIQDGAAMGWSDCHKEDVKLRFQGCQITQTCLRPFRFGTIETVSDEYHTSEEAVLVERLGALCVTVFCIRQITVEARPAPFFGASKDIGIISEKALKGKALSHHVSLEDETIAGRWGTYSTSYDYLTVDKDDLPVPAAKFEFRYRSLDALKSLLIIPRTPSPPLLEDRAFDSLSREELIELQKRAKAAKEKDDLAVKVKRERSDDNPRPRKARRQATGRMLLEMDEEGSFREIPLADSPQRDVEVVELE